MKDKRSFDKSSIAKVIKEQQEHLVHFKQIMKEALAE